MLTEGAEASLALCAASIRPTKVVVVVLPLEPEMPMVGAGLRCTVSSASLLKGIPCRRARHEGDLGRHAAAEAEQVTVVEKFRRMTAENQTHR